MGCESTQAGTTPSSNVLGSRKNTVGLWVLFRSGDWQHHSASIPGYALWINLVLIVTG